MILWDKIVEIKEKSIYIANLAQVSNPLMNKIDKLEPTEVKEFFKVILDAAERSLRGILFIAPSEFDFVISPSERIQKDKNYGIKQMKEKSAFYKRLITEQIEFWLRKVSLALISYSYYYFSGGGDIPLVQFSYDLYWKRICIFYNIIFNEKINIDSINHYSTGLREDIKKGYSKSGNIEKVGRLIIKDYTVIAPELLEKIWNITVSQKAINDLQNYSPGSGMKNLDPLSKKIIFLGNRIWQSYQQIVQPFLPELLTNK